MISFGASCPSRCPPALLIGALDLLPLRQEVLAAGIDMIEPFQ